jgi:hypothetical protein
MTAMEERESIINRSKINPNHRNLLEGISGNELITAICVLKEQKIKDIPKLRKLIEDVSSFNRGKIFGLVEAYGLGPVHSMLHTQRITGTEKLSKDELLGQIFADYHSFESLQAAKKVIRTVPGCKKFPSTASVAELAHVINERGEYTITNAVKGVSPSDRKLFLKQLILNHPLK